MTPEVGKAWFQIAIFILLVSGILVLVTARDSAEFIISVAAFVIGLVLLAIVVIMVRRSNR